MYKDATECYFAINEDEILPLETQLMKIEVIMLSEMSKLLKSLTPM